jgi:pSer/pThr/pTyr-binding forkhead associated (FHA) protein
MPGQLLVVAGPDQGRSFPLEEGQTLVIGRGLNTETKLTDPRVSRVHCQVRFAGDRLHLTDAGSSTGTLVNDRPVVEQDLAPGDTFQVGGTRLRFDVGGGEEAATLLVSALRPELLGADLGEPRYRHLKAHAEGGTLVLTLTEHQVLDEELAEAMRVEMLTAVTHAGARRVVVDFGAVKSVSGAICRPLVSLRGRLVDPGDRLVLCGLSVMVEQVLRMSGMIEAHAASGPCFETDTDRAAALARLRGAG